jgi:hypothetical protein
MQLKHRLFLWLIIKPLTIPRIIICYYIDVLLTTIAMAPVLYYLRRYRRGKITKGECLEGIESWFPAYHTEGWPAMLVGLEYRQLKTTNNN